MKPTTQSIAEEIERYLRTGDSDPRHSAWPGQSFLDSARSAHRDLIDALVAEVRRRAGTRLPPAPLEGLDVLALTRRKVEPMIRGLFPRAEQDTVLGLVERSVVFLTPDNIEETLREGSSWLRSSWDIANIYLDSMDAELLGDDAPRIVGMSEGTSCFVSATYLEDDSSFSDFVVHEVAHIFHNCKRASVGLRGTRRREWLLDIEFRKRETFAYACEAYARIVEQAPRLRDRTELALEFGRSFPPGDERVDPAEVADIVREASGRRNGWKVILARCAPPRPTRPAPGDRIGSQRRT